MDWEAPVCCCPGQFSLHVTIEWEPSLEPLLHTSADDRWHTNFGLEVLSVPLRKVVDQKTKQQ